MFAFGFAAGVVVGTAFGWIVCAVITSDKRQGEMFDDYYIQEDDM